jgi:AcrR family transcriptional regulator
MKAKHDPIREQLIEARRNQLLDAATEVFAARGFHGATTRMIAEAAGVAEGTIYNYFDSKADLLVAIMTRLSQLELLDAWLTRAPEEDMRQFLHAILEQRVVLIERNDDTIRAIMPQVLVEDDLRERFYRQFVQPIASVLEQYVQQWVEAGDIAPVDVPLTVRVIQALIIGLLFMRILGDEALIAHWDEVPQVLTSLILDGLNVQAGREE